MSVDLRVYDNDQGDPVVVMVTTGTFDVSRLAHLMAQGRCEDLGRSRAINRALSRHNGGRSALKLLTEHGGPDLLERVTEGPSLRFDGTRCEWDVKALDGEYDQCPDSSRYRVERSDHDPAFRRPPEEYGPAETCEAHLAETVCALIDGNDRLAAVVKVRWT